ncbi:MAG: hypothetical protein HKO59_05790 [Phycisphaerales bacterium]|nr:hypothetical protein [Phycisphaerae bacterium]NNF44742.1 hypothetical protein [Phycisphaerales bacterium]NNM25484.1 hypothetical protein [Phycisphaerales bacterium]
MSRFGTHYQVSRLTGVCAETGEKLEPGSLCVATLCDRAEDEGFDRKDYSMTAWEQGARPERLFSFWRTEVAAPEARRKLLVDDEVLMDLFTRLADDDRPQRVAFRFVLALILMRKRLLRFLGRRSDEAAGREWWKLRPRGAAPEDPPLEVLDPRLSDEDVRELTAQLGEVLRGDMEG